MDLVVRAPNIASPIFHGLMVVSAALSKEALAIGSAVRDGAAAAAVARGKARDYPHCRITPFAVEDHGRLGDAALQLVRLLAPVDLAKRLVAMRRLHQTLGATLQRVAADAVLAAGPRGD